MRYSHSVFVRNCFAIFNLGLAFALIPSSSLAGLLEWSAAVGTGTASTFTATNVADFPQIVDIGPLSGEVSYEFIANGSDVSNSSALMGYFDLSAFEGQAIKFEQFNNTGEYGITQYVVSDESFNATTTFDSDVHLALVTSGGETALYVNGSPAGSPIPISLTLSGSVVLGAGWYNPPTGGSTFAPPDTFLDEFSGSILGVATYDSALSPSEIQQHASAFFSSAPVPEPASLAWLGCCGLVIGLRRRR